MQKQKYHKESKTISQACSKHPVCMSYYNLLKESSTKKIIIMSHIQLLEGKLGKPEGMEGQISIEGKKDTEAAR